ncbi:hypothetical protein CLOM_g18727 [Closterium sp. NIES-68]|nr:hypothetical protein CLOM_g18727 [Closterium sp. NIES-68]GJP74750.1 hypothetical protein CLOP_g5290 [Closterium sp. NIES-67]
MAKRGMCDSKGGDTGGNEATQCMDKFGDDRLGRGRLGDDRLGRGRLGDDRLGRDRPGTHMEQQRHEREPSVSCGPSASCVSSAMATTARARDVQCDDGGDGYRGGSRGDTNEGDVGRRDINEGGASGASRDAGDDVAADQVPLPNHPGWVTTKRRKTLKEELIEVELAMEREYEAGRSAAKKAKTEGGCETGSGGGRAGRRGGGESEYERERGGRRGGGAGVEGEVVDGEQEAVERDWRERGEVQGGYAVGAESGSYHQLRGSETGREREREIERAWARELERERQREWQSQWQQQQQEQEQRQQRQSRQRGRVEAFGLEEDDFIDQMVPED